MTNKLSKSLKNNSYLTFIDRNFIGELSTMPYVQIIPAHQSNRLPVMILLGRVERQRVGAVVRYVLARLGRKQLEEADLVAVGFVGEVEATVGNV